MLNTVSAKQIQRGYKKIFEQANKRREPVVVITRNKPVGAVIGLELLDELNKKLQLEVLEQEALEEYRRGRVKKISTDKDLKAFFEEIREAAS